MTKVNVFWIMLALFSLTSCSSFGDEEVKMNDLNGVWHKNNPQKFEFEIKDAQNPKNIIFVIRNNNDYPFSNLYLISKISKGNKVLGKIDTLNYVLAMPNGEWVGRGFGSTKEALFQYKVNYKFPENGVYNIELKQAMRKDTLKGIEDIGVTIQSLK
ncbi:gliding motility lipoprotein GldH [Riemerella anatipestifer]|uniref:gliding motility lipoprotein GldH n=1 Tax=Riemerella anatipestifer TaxID=34085 RepID=UPI0012ADB7A2|nr:gliding motility lipoprotein GldH [Riemerella anatipestifer]USL96395.1 gliding motility lipoprotein GldH [Riemerella anatipestifer]